MRKKWPYSYAMIIKLLRLFIYLFILSLSRTPHTHTTHSLPLLVDVNTAGRANSKHHTSCAQHNHHHKH